MLIYTLLVDLVAAVVIKYQVLPLNISRKRETTSIYYNARQDYRHLLNSRERLLASTTTQGRATEATAEGTRVPGYCNYRGYVELQNHVAFP